METTGGNAKGRHDDGLAAALSSVKSIVSIVMGLALTHTIVTLLSAEESGGAEALRHASRGVTSLSELSPRSVLCALAVITAIVRFYHGNNQLLDLLYGDNSGKESGKTDRGIGGNFIVIMVQSIFFAVMSFYVNGERELILLFGILLLFDIFWFIANLPTTEADPEARRLQQNWMYNNLGFLVVLAALYYTNNGNWAVTAGACAILSNTLIDFRLSWKAYFPRPGTAKVSA